MIKRSRSPLRVAALLAAALAAPLVGVLPAHATPAAAAVPAQEPFGWRAECVDGSRDIDTTEARDRARAVMNGSRGRTEITLRSNADGSCWWGLIAGPGQTWLERERLPEFGTALPDGRLHQESNDGNKTTHTAAAVTTQDRLRLCALPMNGEFTSGWKLNLDVSRDGPGGGGEYAKEVKGEYGTDAYCTDWLTADNPRPTNGEITWLF